MAGDDAPLALVAADFSLNRVLAILAFGGLTKEDVKIVEFAGYGAMWKGMVNNDVDAAFASTITAPAKEVETSPRGILWPPMPPGWPCTGSQSFLGLS